MRSRRIEVEDHGAGIDIQIRLKDRANTRFEARRRRLAGPVGCGLCGIESIEEAMRSVGRSRCVTTYAFRQRYRALGQAAVESAAAACRDRRGARRRLLPPRQGYRDGARGCRPPQCAGQAGRRARRSRHRRCRAALSSSRRRVSVEMVQKTAAIGAPFIIAVSAPTALAIRTADEAGMTLVALVRGDGFRHFHPSGTDVA